MDVKTAGRTVELFEIFARARAPLTLSELARALNAPQSSCFNLLRALEARGYLYSVGGNKRVYPTRKLFDLAEAIAGYDPVIPRVEATLAALRDRTHETVILGTRQGEQVIYLAVAEGRQTIRYISRAGELKPMHASAIGKALLMAMPEAERERLVHRLPLAAATARTVTDPERLLADIAAAAARGYAQTEGENVADVMAVACPLRVEAISYAIAVAGPVGRMAPRAGEVAGWVRHAIDALE
ncbi:MAG: IclR family transcriptional regulator [Janthinobacterium lividum]